MKHYVVIVIQLFKNIIHNTITVYIYIYNVHI